MKPARKILFGRGRGFWRNFARAGCARQLRSLPQKSCRSDAVSRLSAALRKLVPQGIQSFHKQFEWPSHASQGWVRGNFQGRCTHLSGRTVPVWAACNFLWAGQNANFLTGGAADSSVGLCRGPQLSTISLSLSPSPRWRWRCRQHCCPSRARAAW